MKFGLLLPQGWTMDLVGITDPEEQRTHAEHALAEAAAGRLVAEIGQTYPLERARRSAKCYSSPETSNLSALVYQSRTRPS